MNEKRIKIVNRIIETLRRLEDLKLEYDKEKFVFEIITQYGISGKTAKEYIKTAEFLIERDKGENEKTN